MIRVGVFRIEPDSLGAVGDGAIEIALGEVGLAASAKRDLLLDIFFSTYFGYVSGNR
jgi:hypothetical protein